MKTKQGAATSWRSEGDWVRLTDWEKKFGVLAGVTSRALGNMKDPDVFRRRVGAAGLDPDRWAGGQQVHGARVVSVARPRLKEKPRTDGVVTDAAGLALRVFTADCVPVFLIDPVQRAIGLIHAGWRGVQKDIVRTAIQTLAREYHSRPQDVCVALGPHIGGCCFEVGPEVAAVFQGTRGAVSGGKRGANDRRRLHLSAVLHAQSVRAGVRREKIIPAPGCTVCDPHYFSYRRDKTDQRQAAILCIHGARASLPQGGK